MIRHVCAALARIHFVDMEIAYVTSADDACRGIRDHTDYTGDDSCTNAGAVLGAGYGTVCELNR